MEGALTGAVITGSNAVGFEDKIAFFPNPANNLLNISYGFMNQQTQVILQTITGQLVFESQQMVQTIDLSNLSKGIYFLKIISDGERCVKKVNKL